LETFRISTSVTNIDDIVIDTLNNTKDSGVILKSIPCDISVNEVTQEEKSYIHLVFADEFETNDRKLVDLKLGKQFHKKMGGELYSLDLVESKEMFN